MNAAIDSIPGELNCNFYYVLSLECSLIWIRLKTLLPLFIIDLLCIDLTQFNLSWKGSLDLFYSSCRKRNMKVLFSCVQPTIIFNLILAMASMLSHSMWLIYSKTLDLYLNRALFCYYSSSLTWLRILVFVQLLFDEFDYFSNQFE